MGKSADLKLKVTSDTSQATTGLGSLKNKMSDLGNNQGLTSFNKGLLAVVPAAAAVGLAVSKIVSATKEWVDLYTIQEQAETKLQATLSATGNQIGMTVDELGDYASSLQKTTTYGDETILGVEQLMVATKSLSKEGLQRATVDSLDLATAMGTSVTSAGQQLARALTDPIGQLTTLKRMNINFTDSEKDKIKTLMETNRVEDAQNIILSKVESTYGGIAESVGALDSSKLTQISNVVGDIKEDLGEGFVLSLAPAFEWILDSLYKIEGVMHNATDTISGQSSYNSIVKWQKNGMNSAEAPTEGSINWEGARNSAYTSILDTYRVDSMGNRDRNDRYPSGEIQEAYEKEDYAGAVDLIKTALGKDLYTKPGFLDSLKYYNQAFMALETINTHEQYVPEKTTLSKFTSASSSAQLTSATSEPEVQTVTDFISSNKTASDSAQKQYYQELINKANEYKTTATATEGEKTSLDEMITTWNEKKEAIGKTTEEVSIYGEFVKSNSALSVSAQEEDIQAQINKATALSNNNALSEKQKTILDEIIIKLKEQQAVLEAPVENAIDNYIKENSTYSNTAVVDAISEQVKYAESLLESSDLTDTQRQKLTEILAALKAIKEEASNPDSNNDIISDDTSEIISDDTSEIISSSLNLLQTSTNLIDQLFTNSINTKKEQLEELQNAFKLTSDSAKESAISQISSLDKQYGEGLISLSDYEAKVKSVYATKNATIAEAAEVEESKQKEIDKLKERQFNADKANNLLQALANGALGITDIWSKHGANPILAGVLTGIETAAISTSMATIASQKYTSLATGGFVSGSTHALIGEAGTDEVVLPLQQDIFDKYGLSSKGSNNGTGVINFNINISGGSDSNNTTKAVYNAIEKAQRTGYIPRWNYAK